MMARLASSPKQAEPDRLDPYWIWSLLSRPELYRQAAQPMDSKDIALSEANLIHLLVQTRKPDIPFLIGLGLVPVHMHATGADQTRPVCYVSGLVDIAGLRRVISAAFAPDSLIVRFELAAPRDRQRSGPDHSFATNQAPKAVPKDSIAWTAGQLHDFLKKQASARPSPNQPVKPAPKSLPLVCVIDDRPNAFSESLLGGQQALDWSSWHQGGEAETLKLLDESNAFAPAMSLIWSGANIVDFDGAWLGRRPKPSPDPAKGIGAQAGDSSMRAYQGQLVQWPPPATSHGSAVLDLVRGRALWSGHPPDGPAWISRKVTHRTRPQRVHFVQLPIPTVVDTAGGSLAASVLDGIHDALYQAEPNQDVIVNISFGTHSGGHDGTSMLEGAICELLDLYNGTPEAQGKKLHVVLPAGNSHLLRCHAMGTLCPHTTAGETGPKHTLLWKVQPDTPVDSFMEVWLPESAEIVISMYAPDGSPPSSITLTPTKGVVSSEYLNRQSKRIGAIISPQTPAQSLRGRMVLLAITPSGKPNAPLESQVVLDKDLGAFFGQGSSKAPAISPHGIWTITLAANGRERVPFHAWIQRADTAPLRGRSSRGYGGRQSQFLDTPEGGVDPRFTLNGIATFSHERLFVVGAMRHSDNCLSVYSAAGPNRGETSRCEGPNWVVRADESRNVPGLLVSGFHGGAWHRVSGTSMAAAVFTRHLYEHLSQGGTAASFQHLPHQYDKCHSANFDASCKELVPAGAPEHAHPLHRGIWHRLVPWKSDGSY
jgi:hypothetical protein